MAWAQELPTSVTEPVFSGSIAETSQYVSRGVRQTWGRDARQIGLDWTYPDGWSLGIWMSDVNRRFIEGGRAEVDVYLTYARSVGDLGLNAGLTHYLYPGARISETGTRFDYTELMLGTTWKTLYAKAYFTVTQDFFGITDARGTVYVDLGANPELAPGWVLNLHAGSGKVAGSKNQIWNWSDVKIGLTRNWSPSWSTSIAWTHGFGMSDAYRQYMSSVLDKEGSPLVSNVGAGTVVLSLTRAF